MFTRLLLIIFIISYTENSLSAAAAEAESSSLLDGKEFVKCNKNVVLIPVHHYRLAEEDKSLFIRTAITSPYEDSITNSRTFFHKRGDDIVVSIFAGNSSENSMDYFSSIFSEKILPKVTLPDDVTSIFFIGTNREAGLAAIAASELIKREKDKYYGKNRVKVIGFGSIGLTEDQISSIHGLVGRKNILSFFNSNFLSVKGLFSLSTPPRIGVPMMILPSEQMADNLPRIYYTSLEISTAISGSVSAVFASNALTNPSSPSSAVAIATATAATAVVSKVGVDFSVHPIPSDALITGALEYTQGNILLNESEGYDIEAVGVPPLLSSQRGVGGWFYSFFL